MVAMGGEASADDSGLVNLTNTWQRRTILEWRRS
jgi:hypothetical protein